MAALLVWHCEALPVLSTSGVEYPWQVQPRTVTGAPPPVPGTFPALIMAAYSFSTCIATPQFTVPFATLMMIGTFAAVWVEPQVAPTPTSRAAEDAQPASKPVPPASRTQQIAIEPSPGAAATRPPAAGRPAPSRSTF
jgi:hypothetical protein